MKIVVFSPQLPLSILSESTKNNVSEILDKPKSAKRLHCVKVNMINLKGKEIG